MENLPAEEKMSASFAGELTPNLGAKGILILLHLQKSIFIKWINR